MFGLFASIVVGEVRGEAVGVMGVLRLGQALEECAHDVELRSARHGTTEDSGCLTTPAASAVPTRVSSPGSGVSSNGTLRREQGAGRVGVVGRAVAFSWPGPGPPSRHRRVVRSPLGWWAVYAAGVMRGN